MASNNNAAAIDRTLNILFLRTSIVPTAVFTGILLYFTVSNLLDLTIAVVGLIALFVCYVGFFYSFFLYKLATPRCGCQKIKYIVELVVFWAGSILALWLFVLFAVYLRNVIVCTSSTSSCDSGPYWIGLIASIVIGVYIFLFSWAIYAAKESYEEMAVEVYRSNKALGGVKTS